MKDFFFTFASYIDTINNYIQFILVIFTIFATLLYFMLPYIRPLRTLLKSLGLGRREISRILWISYKNPRRYIRIYIELALIKSRGIHQDKKWWHNLRRIFKKFIDDNQSSNDYIVTVDTSFDLAPTEYNEKVKAYFDYFKKPKIAQGFAIPDNEPISFITNIEINEGYIVPITFIMGLNDRYDEDWVKILSNFFTAFGNDTPPETAILPEELYFTYNWLMWGPSYQNKYDKDKNKLIQFGFGDESNSVNIILKSNDKGREIWDLFCHEAEVTGEKKFGYNCSVKGKFFDTSEYYKYNYDKVDIRSVPFLKRLSSETLGIPYLVELSDFEIKTSHKAENYFFSAYLWIMFGLIDSENPSFTPRKSVTFFEHANLADINNYNFLAHSLIDKCFRHFDYIAQHPLYKNRKYHLCLSMNSFIEKLFLQKLEEIYKTPLGAWYREHMSTHTPFSISEILDTFDNYFVNQEDEYNIIEADLNDKQSIKYLCNFYVETFLAEFKNTDCLTLDKILELLKTDDKDYNFHITLAVSPDDEVLGGAVSLFIPKAHCGIIDSIAIHENHRNYGIGKRLLNNSLQLMRQDALQHKKHTLDFILAPVPSLCFEEPNCKKYRFWENNGFIKTDITDERNKLSWCCYHLKPKESMNLTHASLEKIIARYNNLRNKSK